MKKQSVDYIVTKMVKRVWNEGSEIEIRIQERVDRNLTTKEISVKKRTHSIKEAIEELRKKYNVDTENILSISTLIIYNGIEIAFIRWDSELKKYDIIMYDNGEVIGKEISIEKLIGKEILDNANKLEWMIVVSENSNYELRANDMENSSIDCIEVRIVDGTDNMDVEESGRVTEIKNIGIEIDISGCKEVHRVNFYKASEYINIVRAKIKGEYGDSKDGIKMDFGGVALRGEKIGEIYVEGIEEASILVDTTVGKLSMDRCGIGKIESLSYITKRKCDIDMLYLNSIRSTKNTEFVIGKSVVIADKESREVLTESRFKPDKVIEASKEDINKYMDRAKKLNIDLRGTLLIKTED